MFDNPFWIGSDDDDLGDLLRVGNPRIVEGHWYRERELGDPEQPDHRFPVQVFLDRARWLEREQDWMMRAMWPAPQAAANAVPNLEETPRQRQRRLEREHLAQLQAEQARVNALQREHAQRELAELPEIGLEEGKTMAAKVKLTSFKLPIETVEDLRMRFHGTIITLKGKAYYVQDTYLSGAGEIGLVLDDGTGKRGRVPYNKIEDVRSPPPGYITLGADIGYFSRVPVRNQSQGLTGQNTVIRGLPVRGGNGRLRFDIYPMIEGLNNRGTTKWSNEFERMFREGGVVQSRLCNEIAVYADKGKGKLEVKAAYMGRDLGVIRDDQVIADDPDDLLTGWIADECNAVGLRLAA